MIIIIKTYATFLLNCTCLIQLSFRMTNWYSLIQTLYQLINMMNYSIWMRSAGWPEQILELNTGKGDYYTKIWGIWQNIKHGDSVPDFITDIYEEPGTCINAGLLVVKPDKSLFDFFINQLRTPKNEWFGETIFT